jgi:hypothetical protein
MSLFRSFLILAVLSSLLNGCKEKSENADEKEVVTQKLPMESTTIIGRYVTDSYESRGEGYDWVAVHVSKVSENEISLKIRSRADRKKPTCTFDTNAYRVNDSVYTAFVEGKPMLVTFSTHSVWIAAENSEDESVLSYFCSGGATLAGKYHKIFDPIDTSQIDKTTFSKNFQFQGVDFNITAKPINGTQQDLVINTHGLELNDQAISKTIDGIVVDAVVEDLDSDGFPEVLVFTQSGPHKKGNVTACSVLMKKSMILLHFPSTEENLKINQGYDGNDSFTLIENNLVQRFPLYENGQATGKMRQISYKLQKGEATKVFTVQNSIVVDSY